MQGQDFTDVISDGRFDTVDCGSDDTIPGFYHRTADAAGGAGKGHPGQRLAKTGEPLLGIASENLGALLRTARHRSELTLDQVARQIGVSKPTVWAWEKGRARPARRKWQAIAKALGVTVQELACAADAQRAAGIAGLPPAQGARDRTALLAAAREMIANAYDVMPSAVRITVEV